MRTLGGVQPTRQQRCDIDFALPLLQQLVEQEAGRALAVRERDVIGVGALEPLSETITRAGRLCRRKGWTLVASVASAPDAETIRTLARAGGGCLAVTVGPDDPLEPEAVREADRARIALVALADGSC